MKRKRSNKVADALVVRSNKGSNKPTGLTGGSNIPEFARVLPERTIKTVLAVLHNRAALGLYDDSAGRWLWAVSYYEWEGGLPCK